MTTDNLFRQRKYTLALIFTVSTITALFFGFLSGGEFIFAMGAILALYGGANVWEQQIGKKDVK